MVESSFIKFQVEKKEFEILIFLIEYILTLCREIMSIILIYDIGYSLSNL